MQVRKILSHDEAKPILEPYLDKITKAIEQAFKDFQNVVNAANEANFTTYAPTTKANILHNHVVARIQDVFQGVENVHTNIYRRMFALNIGYDLFIRFKKLNPDLSYSGIRTKQFKNYSKQLPIGGVPDEPTFLTAGYIPNKTWTDLVGIYIVCRINDHLQWYLELKSGSSMVQSSLFDRGATASEARVKIKTPNQTDDKKTGTND